VVLAVIAVINSAIGAAYYLRIAAACYLREPTEEVEREGGAPLRLGLAICSLAMIVLFIRPNGVVREAQKAAQGLESVSQPALVKLAADAS
jgi:NADH:ubiquinone oxidoreductase subunit 2 (subunit N)